MKMSFNVYSVISLDESHKTLGVKHYTNKEEYDKEIQIMHSSFETEPEATRECKRICRMNGGKAIINGKEFNYK